MNGEIKKLILFWMIFFSLALTSLLHARNYVPPPDGPYQSSVVIESNQSNSSQQQVYKFPPADLIIEDKPVIDDPAVENTFPLPSVERPAKTNPAPQAFDQNLYQQPPAQLMPQAENKDYQMWRKPSGPSANNQMQMDPAYQWYGYQAAPPNSNQGAWQQYPGYAYPYQNPYPYGNPNQYNEMYNPFQGMPSPWSAMPKNPFFSDK